MGSYPETYGPYKLHYPCFKCRKCFKPRNAIPRRDVIRCPQCGDLLRAYNIYFKVPPHNDVKAWKVLKAANRPEFTWSHDIFPAKKAEQHLQYDAATYEAVYGAIDELSNPLPSKREYARKTLLKIGRPALFPLLEKLQRESPNFSSDCEFIIGVLGDYGDSLAVEPIIRALETGSDRIRLSALVALGKLHSDEITNAVIAALGEPAADKKLDKLIQSAAVKTLAQRGWPHVLIAFLTHENSRIRAGVAEALGKMSSRKNVSEQSLQKSVIHLQALLRDPSIEVRREAGLALRRLVK